MKAVRALLSTRRRASSLLGLIIAACLWSPAAFTADNPGTHQHGEARLQMAFEANRIELMLTSPAHNLAGFEHAAQSEEEKQVLRNIRGWLQATPLVEPVDGACRVVESEVDLSGSLPHTDDDGHDHGHGHDDDQHSDHEATQILACEETVAGGLFTSPLVARFAELNTLIIEWVGESGQGSGIVSSSDDQFRLGQQ